MRPIAIPLLALLLAGPALADGTIRGQVVDARTKTPLLGARLTLDAAGQAQPLETVTDGAGEYAFSGLPAGRYTLGVRANDFKPFKRPDIPLREDRTLRVNIELLPEHFD